MAAAKELKGEGGGGLIRKHVKKMWRDPPLYNPLDVGWSLVCYVLKYHWEGEGSFLFST